MKDTYYYPAIFHPEADGKYWIEFPNLKGCNSCGDNLEDALYMAKDCLEGYLLCLELDNEPIPEPQTITSDDPVYIISAYMPPIRESESHNKL